MTNDTRDDWGDDGELGPLLGAYAETRLGADPERTRLVRARVLAEAGRATGQHLAARGPAVPALAAFRRPLRGVLLAAAALLIVLGVVGGAIAASGPGGVAYGARLWLEEVTLPSDPAARLDAQGHRLDERLAEAERAAAEGNGGAVTAALDAYRAIADEAAGDAGVDLSLREHVALQIGRHVAVLQALLRGVPPRAADAIRAAVDRTEVRIEEILATPPDQPVAPGGPPTPGTPTDPGRPTAVPGKPADPGGPTAAPGTGPAATPGRTPPGRPEATPKPAKTPRPGRTPEPAATSAPAKSPGPARTPPGQVEPTASPAP